MTPVKQSRGRRLNAGGKLDADDAIIALLIAATDASGHTSAEERARAYHIIWSMRRFRYRSGDAVRRIARVQGLIKGARRLVGHRGCSTADPERLRRAAFAVAADLVLVDGRLQRSEERFLGGSLPILGLIGKLPNVSWK